MLILIFYAIKAFKKEKNLNIILIYNKLTKKVKK